MKGSGQNSLGGVSGLELVSSIEFFTTYIEDACEMVERSIAYWGVVRRLTLQKRLLVAEVFHYSHSAWICSLLENQTVTTLFEHIPTKNFENHLPTPISPFHRCLAEVELV